MVKYVEIGRSFYKGVMLQMNEDQQNEAQNNNAPKAENKQDEFQDVKRVLKLVIKHKKKTIAIVGVLISFLFITIPKAGTWWSKTNETLSSVTSLNTRIEALEELPSRFDSLQKSIDELPSSIISSIELNQSNFEVRFYRDILPKVTATNPQITDYVQINAKTIFNRRVNQFHINTYDIIQVSALDFSNDEIIGENEQNEELTFGELFGTSFCTNYHENGNDIWFYGNLNERGYWDGYCILNEYNADGEMVALVEAIYSDGELVGAYRAIVKEDNQYVFNERIHKDGYNIGQTFIYTSVEIPDNKIKSKKPIRYDEYAGNNLIKYYSGRTSEGKFNDTSGYALYIGYVEGKARILYQGSFKEGAFSDNRKVDEESRTPNNSAFMIALGDDETSYFYYIGQFSDGKPTERKWKTQPEDYKIDNPSERLPQRNDLPDFEWKPIRSAVSST